MIHFFFMTKLCIYLDYCSIGVFQSLQKSFCEKFLYYTENTKNTSEKMWGQGWNSRMIWHDNMSLLKLNDSKHFLATMFDL